MVPTSMLADRTGRAPTEVHEVDASTGSGRRTEPTPRVSAGSARAGCQDRVAWLLRTNRLYGADEKLAVGSKFAEAFRGAGFPHPIDRAQVSRWERAAQRAGFSALRRYEELLDLPPHRL